MRWLLNSLRVLRFEAIGRGLGMENAVRLFGEVEDNTRS